MEEVVSVRVLYVLLRTDATLFKSLKTRMEFVPCSAGKLHVGLLKYRKPTYIAKKGNESLAFYLIVSIIIFLF